MDYMIAQKERGEQGTEHYQGYVRFKAPRTLGGAKNAIHRGAHLEVPRGTEEDNRNYCSKDDTSIPGTRFEAGTYNGEFGHRGRRTDLKALADAIKAGLPLAQVAREQTETFIKYHAGAERLAALLSAEKIPPQREIHTTILWGPTGTGKSHRVRSTFPDAFIVRQGRDPFSSYSGQDVVVFEEFDAEKWSVPLLNELLDKWKLELDSRYFNKPAAWTKVYILANTDPVTWFNLHQNRMQVEALRRRLESPMGRIYHVESQDQPVNLQWWLMEPPAAAPADLPPPPTPPQDVAPAAEITLPPDSPLPTQIPGHLTRTLSEDLNAIAYNSGVLGHGSIDDPFDL